jgi:hypothetical protein
MLLSATCRRFSGFLLLRFVDLFLSTQHLTQTVLECSAVGIAHDTLVDDAETQLVTILGLAIACQ